MNWGGGTSILTTANPGSWDFSAQGLLLIKSYLFKLITILPNRAPMKVGLLTFPELPSTFLSLALILWPGAVGASSLHYHLPLPCFPQTSSTMGPISEAVSAVQEVPSHTAPLSSDFCIIVKYSKAKASSYTLFA